MSSSNPLLKVYNDNKMIIGKTSIESSNYNCLIFCVRNIKYVKIPNFIEHISSFAFFGCKQIQRFEFEKYSKLKT